MIHSVRYTVFYSRICRLINDELNKVQPVKIVNYFPVADFRKLIDASNRRSSSRRVGGSKTRYIVGTFD